MDTINISVEKFDKVMADVETLIEDVAELLDQDEMAKNRIADIKANPSIGKREQELEKYLKNRGVNVE